MGLVWAGSSQSSPAIFWTLLLLLEHPDAWNACLQQVQAISTSPSHVFTLDELDQLTYLQSAFFEALRLYTGAGTTRVVKEDFVVEAPGPTTNPTVATASTPFTGTRKYLFEKGSKVMSFWDLLHSDPNVFESPGQFRFDRFVSMVDRDKLEQKGHRTGPSVNADNQFTYKSGKPLTHSPVMSFGGAAHLCPGRKFVNYECRLYIALIMLNLELRLVEGESRPGVDLAMQGIGVSFPDGDIQVQVRPRQLC